MFAEQKWNNEKMERNIFISLSILLTSMASLFAYYKEDKRNTQIKAGRVDINENEFVRIRVVPENDLINLSLKLIIENQSKRELIYGPDFSLEYFDEGKWTEVRLDYCFDPIGYVLTTEETSEELFSLLERDSYRLGKYRIIKNFSLVHAYPLVEEYSNDFESFDLYAEFEIK